MPGVQAALAEIGWAFQASEGAPAAQPDFVVQGQMTPGLPEPTQHLETWLAAHPRSIPQKIRKGMEGWVASVEVPAMPIATGPLLKGILAAEAVSGASPYDHAFTPAITDRWISLFSKRPDDLYERYAHGLVESVTAVFRSGEPLSLSVTAMGKTPSVQGVWTPGTTEAMDQTTSWMTMVEAEILIDPDNQGTPTNDQSSHIEGGSVLVRRPMEFIPKADAPGPQGFRRSQFEVMVNLEMTWKNYHFYRATYYGAIAGTNVSSTVVYGSFKATFQSVSDANRSLEIWVPKVQFRCMAPQPSASGLLTQYIEGVAVFPTSNPLTTWTLKNSRATAY